MSVCMNDTDGDGNCAVCARNPEALCRVSAREAIHRLFDSGRTSYRLDAYLDAYAHELAEQIRQAWADHNPKRPGNVTMLSALNAADLIDPEKSAGPVSPGEEPSAVSAPFVARYYRLHVLHEVPCDSIDEAIGFLSMRLDDGDCAIKDVVSPGGVTVLDESATSLRASARMWGHDANEAPVRPDEEPTP